MNQTLTNLAGALRGMWTLVWAQRCTTRALIWMVVAAAAMALLMLNYINTGRERVWMGWVVGFYLHFLVPLTCLNVCGSMMRAEVQANTLSFLTTRPHHRHTLYLLQYVCHVGWLQLVFFICAMGLFALGALKQVEGLGKLLPLFLITQFLAILAWSALSAARRTGKPFVTTFHNAYGHNWLKHHYNAVMAKGDRVIAISEFVAEHVRQTYGVDDDRLVTIHRGIDTNLFDPAKVSAERIIQVSRGWRLDDDRSVIMLPGRLTSWKGQAVLIEALAILGRQDVCCVLVGGDQGRTAYRAELEAAVRQHKLESVVRLVDHCRDMAAAYMLADAVVSASTRPEGFGRVAVEAQAMGRMGGAGEGAAPALWQRQPPIPRAGPAGPGPGPGFFESGPDPL